METAADPLTDKPSPQTSHCPLQLIRFHMITKVISSPLLSPAVHSVFVTKTSRAYQSLQMCFTFWLNSSCAITADRLIVILKKGRNRETKVEMRRSCKTQSSDGIKRNQSAKEDVSWKHNIVCLEVCYTSLLCPPPYTQVSPQMTSSKWRLFSSGDVLRDTYCPFSLNPCMLALLAVIKISTFALRFSCK